MEITAPTSHGSPQGNGAGFYWMKWNLANEISNSNGALDKIDPNNMVMAVQCDFLTGAGECYDVFTSDAYGNYDEFGKYIGIQTWTNYNTDGGNIDAVWLSQQQQGLLRERLCTLTTARTRQVRATNMNCWGPTITTQASILSSCPPPVSRAWAPTRSPSSCVLIPSPTTPVQGIRPKMN